MAAVALVTSVGLLGAALGIDRHDEPAHRGLDEGLAMATLARTPGRFMTDYHTAQMPPARTGRRRGDTWPTRRAELAEHDLKTVLSWRDYLQDAAFEIVLWRRAASGLTLEALGEALIRPRFTLYLGRKSCPLGRPPQPHGLDCETLPAAFGEPDRVIHADVEAQTLLGPTWQVLRRHRRRDRIHERRRWMFALRDELVLAPIAASADAGEPA